MKNKYHQLSLFNDNHVKRSALCRMLYHPPKWLIQRLKLETHHNTVNPTTKYILGSTDVWNLFRHRNGTNMIKIRNRYFYDPITNILTPSI